MVWLIHVLFHSIELVCPLSYVLLMVTAVHMQYTVPLLYRYSIYVLSGVYEPPEGWGRSVCLTYQMC